MADYKTLYKMSRLELPKVHLTTWQLTAIAIVTELFIIRQERLELTEEINHFYRCIVGPSLS